MLEFKEFPKISRLNRTVIVTEKIDGTNSCVIVTEDGQVAAQSRSRLITTQDDNYGFAKWVEVNKAELLKLGPGHHFGEWWGQGIQRKYGLNEKRFSLFNVHLWGKERPSCCHVVPIVLQSLSEDGFRLIDFAISILTKEGSLAAPGFMKPEGVVAFHTHSNTMFKVTLEKDQEHKGSK